MLSSSAFDVFKFELTTIFDFNKSLFFVLFALLSSYNQSTTQSNTNTLTHTQSTYLERETQGGIIVVACGPQREAAKLSHNLNMSMLSARH